MWYAGAGDVVQLVRSDWAFLAFVSVETLERTSLQKAFPWCPSRGLSRAMPATPLLKADSSAVLAPKLEGG